MTTVTLIPDGTTRFISGHWTVIGSGAPDDALSALSDLRFIRHNASDEPEAFEARISFSDYAKQAQTRVASTKIGVRVDREYASPTARVYVGLFIGGVLVSGEKDLGELSTTLSDRLTADMRRWIIPRGHLDRAMSNAGHSNDGRYTQEDVLDAVNVGFRVVALSPSTEAADVSIYQVALKLDVWEASDAPVVTIPAKQGGVVSVTDTPAFSHYVPALGDGRPNRWTSQLRLFARDVWEEPGFDPADPAGSAWSRDLHGSAPSTEANYPEVAFPDQSLFNNTDYRAYVRWGKEEVAGETLWSGWRLNEFTVDLSPPTAPDLQVSTVPADGRNRVAAELPSLTLSGSFVSLEVQRDSGDGWERIRGGYLTADVLSESNTYVFHEYDFPRGVQVSYRARTVEDSSVGDQIASPWAVETVTHVNDGRDWLLTVPDFDYVGYAHIRGGEIDWERPEKVGVFRPPGRTESVVVSDGAGQPYNATLKFSSFDDSKLDAALEHEGRLLLKMKDGTQHYLRATGRTHTDVQHGEMRLRRWEVDVVQVDRGFG